MSEPILDENKTQKCYTNQPMFSDQNWNLQINLTLPSKVYVEEHRVVSHRIPHIYQQRFVLRLGSSLKAKVESQNLQAVNFFRV